MKIAAGRDVGQTIGFCRLSSGPRLTLVKDDRPQKTMVCPTFEWSQVDFRECITMVMKTKGLSKDASCVFESAADCQSASGRRAGCLEYFEQRTWHRPIGNRPAGKFLSNTYPRRRA
jgi:hypothetical protein